MSTVGRGLFPAICSNNDVKSQLLFIEIYCHMK